MIFSVHLDDATAARLKREAVRRKKTRNGAVVEAVKAWLEAGQRTTWPTDLLDWEGAPELTPFERHRKRRREGPRFP